MVSSAPPGLQEVELETPEQEEGKRLEQHVQAAVAILLSCEAKHRPATVDKLASLLLRRGCCRMRNYRLVPAISLAVAVKDMLSEEHPAFGFISPFAAAAEYGAHEPVEQEEMKKATARALCCLKNQDFIGDPVYATATFLCKQAFAASYVKPSELVAELAAKELVSVDAEDASGRLSYSDDELRKVGNPRERVQVDPRSWVQALQGNKKAWSTFKVELAKQIGEQKVQHLPGNFIIPIRPYFTESKQLSEKLSCSFRLVKNKTQLEVKTRKTTRLSEPNLHEALPFFIGPKPAFRIGTNVEHVCGDLIGKKGVRIKGLETEFDACLGLQQEGDHYHLVGWLKTSAFPADVDTEDSLLKQLQDICQKKKEDITKKVNDFMEELSEVKASYSHSGGKAKVALRRTFSSEYQDKKSTRQHDIAKKKLKSQSHKDHLIAKGEREKKNWKKSHDKGPAFHGARHKPGETPVQTESSYLDSTDLPVDDDTYG